MILGIIKLTKMDHLLKGNTYTAEICPNFHGILFNF